MPASRPVAVAVGYYRFTDIFFEWHQALPNPQTVGPLKATIAYDALVHPDHPLRKAGVDGIELYIGTFPNGEARLLFSSAQIEYIRYWIHAVGLAEELIPLPGGDWLIQQNDMLSCSPAVYNDPAVLKKAIKVGVNSSRVKCATHLFIPVAQTIDKNNKRLKGSEPLLTSRRLGFERVRAYWAAKAGTWIAIDIEAWDRDHTVLTEFGWSLIRWENGEEVSEAGHLTVEEHRSYYNTFVAHNREHYSFGESEEVDKKTFKKRIRDLIGDNRSKGPLFLIFHDANQDVKYAHLPLPSEY
ncbi:hypothetical protein EW026_g3009 [Hermanssonia centrifuga]|uniref:Gfd2/YDR514C-like C-terminal domain-containing protein n=1 Tax=Hermanssonia centrifuga TaxID=98765 RepID=A0A4S4KNE4_9APHY|nr:hypothetical protein EW026_g3009 [Hermanssonia centrifuga]